MCGAVLGGWWGGLEPREGVGDTSRLRAKGCGCSDFVCVSLAAFVVVPAPTLLTLAMPQQPYLRNGVVAASSALMLHVLH